MKKRMMGYYGFRGLLAALVILSLSGCNQASKETGYSSEANEEIVTEESSASVKKSKKEKTEEISDNDWVDNNSIEYVGDQFSFRVNADWKENQDPVAFIASDEEIYRPVGVSPMGDESADMLFDHIVEEYEKYDYTIVEQSDAMEDWVAPEEIACQSGWFIAENQGMYIRIEVIAVPQKNLLISIGAEYLDQSQGDTVEENLMKIKNTLSFQVGDQDYISGSRFQMDDGADLCLKADGSFYYYQSDEDHSQNYYQGEYEVYYGQPAFDYLVEKQDYPGGYELLEETLSQHMEGYRLEDSVLDALLEEPKETNSYQVCKDTFYVVVLHNQKLVLEEGESDIQPYDSVYLGYYIPELKFAKMGNMNSQNYFKWYLLGPTLDSDVEPEKSLKE